jgi:hypothetical protein
MRGAIPPLPQYAFMAWCIVKHRDNFTFYLTIICSCSRKFYFISVTASHRDEPLLSLATYPRYYQTHTSTNRSMTDLVKTSREEDILNTEYARLNFITGKFVPAEMLCFLLLQRKAIQVGNKWKHGSYSVERPFVCINS